jgi:hypothetical protein
MQIYLHSIHLTFLPHSHPSYSPQLSKYYHAKHHTRHLSTQHSSTCASPGPCFAPQSQDVLSSLTLQNPELEPLCLHFVFRYQFVNGRDNLIQKQRSTRKRSKGEDPGLRGRRIVLVIETRRGRGSWSQCGGGVWRDWERREGGEW